MEKRIVKFVSPKMKMNEVVEHLVEADAGLIQLTAVAEKALRRKLLWFMNEVMYPQKLEQCKSVPLGNRPDTAKRLVLDDLETWKGRVMNALLDDTHPVLSGDRWGREEVQRDPESGNLGEQTGFYAELMREDPKASHHLEHGIWEGLWAADAAEHARFEEHHPTEDQFWGELDRDHFARGQKWLGQLFDQVNSGTKLTPLQVGKLREYKKVVNRLRFGAPKAEIDPEERRKLRLAKLSYRNWALLRRDIAHLLGEEIKPWMENADDPNHGFQGDVMDSYMVSLVGDGYTWAAEHESVDEESVPEEIAA